MSGNKTGFMGKVGSARSALGGKAGMTRLGHRAVPTPPEAAIDAAQGANKTTASTYITRTPPPGATLSNPTALLYSADRLWATVTLTLETAGPVAVGESADLTPLLSGKGVLLDTGVPMKITLARGTKLYIAADAVNRVKVIVEPLPWLEQIFAAVKRFVA